MAYFSVKEILFKSIFGRNLQEFCFRYLLPPVTRVGDSHISEESGGYIVIEWGIQAKSNTNVNTSINTDYRYRVNLGSWDEMN